MPGLWTQIEIGNDRRTHRVVLRTLSEARWKLGFQPDSAGGHLACRDSRDLKLLYEQKDFAHGPAWLWQDDGR
jgi:hypothetical protein